VLLLKVCGIFATHLIKIMIFSSQIGV